MSRFVDPATKDIIDRLSRSSISHHEHAHEAKSHGYDLADTPPVTSEPLETFKSLPLLQDEPLGSRPAVRVTDRRWLGLVLHSVVVGVVSTALPLTVFPFLTNYLNMEGTQTLSARTLLALPWTLKPFFAIVCDCVPLLGGHHRRPYILLGWLVCTLALLSIYWIDIPPPYFIDRTLVGSPLVALSLDQQARVLNQDAPSHGGLYILLMSVATVGYVLADVAADALMSEIAHAHFFVVGFNQDDVFAPVVTKYRYFSMLFTFLFMGVSMSGWNYGGDFDFSLTYNEVMLLLGVVSALPLAFVWFTVAEARRERRSFHASVGEIWDLFRNRAVNKVILFRFLSGVFAGVSSTAVNPVAFYWAKVQPLNDNVVSFVATSVVLGGLSYANKREWKINYRQLILGATLVVLFLDCGATMFTIWGIVRSQWFWIGLPVMEAIPSGLDYVIFTVVLGELADPGKEAAMSAVVTAVSFLAGPVGLMITKFVDAQLDISNQDLMVDSTHVRYHTTLAFSLAYLCQLLSLGWLLVLPQHANEAREWKKRSENSTQHAVGLLLLLAVAFAWTLAVHVLSVTASTACERVAGGRGCPS